METRSIAVGNFGPKGLWPCHNRFIKFKLSSVGTEDEKDRVFLDKRNYEIVKKVTYDAMSFIEAQKRWKCQMSFEMAIPEINENNQKLYAYNYRPYYNEKYNILFCAIQKNSNRACTRLMMRMADKSDWNKEDDDEYSNREIVQGAREKYLGVDETDLDQLKMLYHGHHTIKAVVVRHPVTRLLSGFKFYNYNKNLN